MSSNSTIYNLEDVGIRAPTDLGEEANCGEVQKGGLEYIVIKKGILDKDKYCIKKNLVERFEDDIVYFGFTKEEANQYRVHETNLI